MLENLILILIGLLVSVYGTLIGAGGGFLVVPILLLFFGFAPQLAVGTSLVFVLFNGLSGGVAYGLKKRINYKLGIPFALLTIPGAIIGAIVTTLFTTETFKTVFAVLLLLSAGAVIIRPRSRLASNPKQRSQMFYGYTISFIVGFISSIFGIGGGIIHVPTMIYFLSMPVHVSTATSQFILVISALLGVLSHSALNHISYTEAVYLSVGALAGGQIGAYISSKTRETIIARSLGLGLALVGLRLLLF